MKTYVTNKVLSFAAVFACIFGSYALLGNTVAQWQAILLAIVIFGYGHFLLGFYYQLRSFTRKPDGWKYFWTFGFLVLFSIAVSYLLFMYVGFVAALFLGFLYFLFHGLLNEQTLIQRQTGERVPLLFLASLAVFVIALLTYSVPDRTFFFDQYLQFADLNDFWVGYIFETYYLRLAYFSQVFWIGFGISLLSLLVAWWRYGFGRLSIFLTALITATTAAVSVFGPPAYIYMYIIVVGYHFMTWFLFYVVEMRKRSPQALRTFLIQNTLIVLPFIIGAYVFFQPGENHVVQWLFNYQLYVIATYVHISTSFLNDEWLIALQNRFFALLGY